MPKPMPQPDALLAAAAEASGQAYCPYSRFAVGAALLTPGGDIITACNVENASFGLTLCAERGAIAAAVARGEREFQAIAIVAGGLEPPHPCGACLQTLVEFCAPELEIYMATLDALPAFKTTTLQALLPSPFQL